jgi:hypothetical protein
MCLPLSQEVLDMGKPGYSKPNATILLTILQFWAYQSGF